MILDSGDESLLAGATVGYLCREWSDEVGYSYAGTVRHCSVGEG